MFTLIIHVKFYFQQSVPSKQMLRLSKITKMLGGNFDRLQARLRDIDPPFLPFLAGSLHVLANIEDTYPAFLMPENVSKVLLLFTFLVY